MRRVDKIINMTKISKDSTINVSEALPGTSKHESLQCKNKKIPRGDNGKINEDTLARLWEFEFDFNDFPAILNPKVEHASSSICIETKMRDYKDFPVILNSKVEHASSIIRSETKMGQLSGIKESISNTDDSEPTFNLHCEKSMPESVNRNMLNICSDKPASILICEETMTESFEENSFCENSDDSVKDKDYVPPQSYSSSECSREIYCRPCSPPLHASTPFCSTVQDTLDVLENKQNNQKKINEELQDIAGSNINEQNEDNSESKQQIEATEESEPTIEHKENEEVSQDRGYLNSKNKEQTLQQVRQNEGNESNSESEHQTEATEENVETQRDRNDEEQYTKRGTIRKRKKFSSSVSERKRAKLDEKKIKQAIKSPCPQTCAKKCNEKFTQTERLKIHDEYVNLGWEAQGVMIKNLISEKKVQSRKKVNENNTYKRKKTYKYFLLSSDKKVEVCKTFFLTTLGYNKKNDKRLLTVLRKDILDLKDKRGRHDNRQKIDTECLENHVLKYNPAISHYRREHAPRRRYLSSDVTINMIFKDYQDTYPDHKISYEFVRSFVTKKMNISFANLSNEECESCTEFKMHKNETKHSEEETNFDCEKCKEYMMHKDRYIQSREKYQNDVETQEKQEEQDCVYFSVDLQKVVMLPRIDMYKIVLFTPRIICFNESFVPLGKFTETRKPIAVLWNEVISGRKQEDIISAFRAFLLERRDDENIVLWADNCSYQNKSWALMTFLVQIVNSNEITAKTVTVKYLEPGHTFMSADSFHHLVEKSLQKQKKVYDFSDFINCVETCTKNVIIKKMDVTDFFLFQDKSSQHKLRNSQPRVYLKNIVAVQVTRGNFDLKYKTCHRDEEFQSLSFLQMKVLKSKDIPKPDAKTSERGIDAERKKLIIENLCPLMPANRRVFWENLHVNDVENLAIVEENAENDNER